MLKFSFDTWWDSVPIPDVTEKMVMKEWLEEQRLNTFSDLCKLDAFKCCPSEFPLRGITALQHSINLLDARLGKFLTRYSVELSIISP